MLLFPSPRSPIQVNHVLPVRVSLSIRYTPARAIRSVNQSPSPCFVDLPGHMRESPILPYCSLMIVVDRSRPKYIVGAEDSFLTFLSLLSLSMPERQAGGQACGQACRYGAEVV